MSADAFVSVWVPRYNPYTHPTIGTAYFIVLEHPIDDLDTSMDVKSLAEHMQLLDITARSLGVKPLSEFYSAEPADIREFLSGEDIDLGDIQPPPLLSTPAPPKA